MSGVGEELAALLGPLVDGVGSAAGLDRLLRELGVLATPSGPVAVPAPLVELAGTATDTVEAVLALDDPAVPAAERVAGLATALTALLAAVDRLGALDAAAVRELGPPFDAPALWPFLARTLPAYLLVDWLRERHRTLFDPLALLGVVAVDGGVPTVDVARLTAVSADLGGSLADVLAADPGVLLGPLRRAFEARGLTAAPPDLLIAGQSVGPGGTGVAPAPARLDVAVPGGPGRPGLAATVEPAAGAAGPGLRISAAGLDRLAAGVDLGGGWSLAGSGGAGVAGLLVGASWTEPLGTSTVDSARVLLTGRPDRPWPLVGGAGATRLELAAASVGIGGSGLTGGAPELELDVGLDGLRLVLAAGEYDRFLAWLLGDTEVAADMSLTGRWSPAGGLVVDGGLGLGIRVRIERTVGPLTVHGLDLALLASSGTGVVLTVTTELTGRFGPIAATVTGMGLRAELRPGDDPGGGVPLGPVRVGLGVEPPTGIGLALESEVASGGGFVDLDRDAGTYTGVLDVDLLGVGVSAVAIIDTRAPEVDGWSMFLALFLDLPSIPVGFGFSLNGVGGLAGVNRTLDTAALSAAVRSGGLDPVLFPADPVAEAPAVVAALRSLFPPSDGRYVFGPVVKIGWGSPPLIEAELGIVLSLPDPVVIAVLGSISSVLPTREADLVALHLDTAGVIDFGARTLSVDAGLHDSHVVGFALSGDMALRASFGDRPSFLMSVGGFHPGFEPGEAFPALRRLALGLSAAPVLDLHFECYFAVTSNTVQFGAAFGLSGEVAGFGIDGGTDFDALVQFSPFLVSTRLGFHIAVTAVGVDLLGVWLDASIEGPNPWYVLGTARFRILGFEEEIRLDVRFGDPVAEAGVAEADLLAALRAALAEPDAWSAVGSASPGVVLTGDHGLAALPDGRLQVSQGAVPLGVVLERAGQAPVGNLDHFHLEPAAGSQPGTGPVRDWFAPAYFFDLPAGELLSAPSFELLDAGIEFGGGPVEAGPARAVRLDVEPILRDPELGVAGEALPPGPLRGALLTAGATARAAGGYAVAAAAPIALAEPGWAVTDRDTGAVLVTAGSWSLASRTEAGRRPTGTVVPAWEAGP